MKVHELENSSAALVWAFFEQLNQIPRGSGNEQGVLDWLKQWAGEKGFATAQDSVGNLVVRAPGTPGYENSPIVIMQSHIDMVCEKNSDSVHDFTKDPICMLCEGDFLKADGTTLGADNGIGLALSLALLGSDTPHPPIEAVFTTSEEVGLTGASAFDMSLLKGKILLNLDTEEEGVFIASNAGGRHTRLILPTQWEAAPAGLAYYRLNVTGLHGGHSGMDIEKERGNAIRLMARALYALRQEVPAFVLADMQAGSQENAIPRESACLIGLPQGAAPKLAALVDTLQATFHRELARSDSGVLLCCAPAEKAGSVFTHTLRDHLIAAILLMPNGIQSMSTAIEGLVESSNNLGVATTTPKRIELVYTIRSSVESRKELIFQQIGALQELLGGACEIISDYPAWEYQADSAVRDLFVRCYKELEGKEPVVTAVHCGLECGIFSDSIQGLDVISFGPDLYDVHSPQEHLSISSTERVWALLQRGMKEMK